MMKDGTPHHLYMRKWRTQKLTKVGALRTNQKRPELQGLSGAKYKSAYKKLIKKINETNRLHSEVRGRNRVLQQQRGKREKADRSTKTRRSRAQVSRRKNDGSKGSGQKTA